MTAGQFWLGFIAVPFAPALPLAPVSPLLPALPPHRQPARRFRRYRQRGWTRRRPSRRRSLVTMSPLKEFPESAFGVATLKIAPPSTIPPAPPLLAAPPPACNVPAEVSWLTVS